uniref:RING-type E3 ubiquitin transferase n=1 Tax=Nicotiana sylvestris TaxID=4096 RepID=A0A1U7WRJ4_NICSY|nr:PREDICTED: E3 ubiquitin-protein ligase RNF181-like [Nicotiana sylvestris]
MNQLQQPDIPHDQTSGISNDSTPNMFEYWEITTYCDLDMDIDDSEERAACFICCLEFQNGDTLVTLPYDDEEQETCAICLCVYQGEDTIGKLQCGHEFHVGCVNKWLQQKNACPFCRAEVLPTHD